VTDGENVYVFFKDFGFVSYDAKGNLRWKTPLGPFTNMQGLGASPIIAGDSLILVADQWEHSYIAAFNLSSGEMRWKVARDEAESWGTPVLVSKIGSGAGDRHREPREAWDAPRFEWQAHSDGDGIGYGRRRQSGCCGGHGVYLWLRQRNAGAVSDRLQRLDKNKDGKLSPDEYGVDPVLNSIAKYEGNRDGIVSEDEWDVFARKVLGPNCLIALRIENGQTRELWRYDKNFNYVVPSTLAYQNVLYIMRNGGILTTHDAATGK